MLRHVALAALFVLAAACKGSSPPPPTEPTPGPTLPGPDDPASGQVDISKLGSDCGADDSCPTGMMCAKYYGIAGASGPEFKSCEIACNEKGGPCPDGTACVTIADGPGQVCRKVMEE